MPATTQDEIAVFFPAGKEALFGILTRPTVKPSGGGIVVLPGGGSGNINRNRVAVRLCRRLADEGYHCLRFDYHGIGESSGIAEQFRLDEPFVEDLEGAVCSLRSRGIDNITLFGNCFGARTALTYAPAMLDLRGVALASPVLRDVALGEHARPPLQREPHPSSDSASSLFLDPLEELLERHVPVLLLYGEDDESYRDFQRAQRGRLGRIFAAAGPLIESAMLPGELEGFVQTATQDAVIQAFSRWLTEQQSQGSASIEEGWS